MSEYEAQPTTEPPLAPAAMPDADPTRTAAAPKPSAPQAAEGENLQPTSKPVQAKGPHSKEGELGLLLVRRHDHDGALQELVEAARLAPDNARYAYVQAIALHSAGRRAEALAVLRGANKRHPQDLDILGALVSINREAGDQQAALRYAREAAVLLPDNADRRARIDVR